MVTTQGLKRSAATTFFTPSVVAFVLVVFLGVFLSLTESSPAGVRDGYKEGCGTVIPDFGIYQCQYGEWCFDGSCVEDRWQIKEGAGWSDRGGRISTLREVNYILDVNSCKEVCDRTVNCVGFTYVGDENRCDLKDFRQADKLKLGYTRSIVSGRKEH